MVQEQSSTSVLSFHHHSWHLTAEHRAEGYICWFWTERPNILIITNAGYQIVVPGHLKAQNIYLHVDILAKTQFHTLNQEHHPHKTLHSAMRRFQGIQIISFLGTDIDNFQDQNF
jgi:hypothetical protein